MKVPSPAGPSRSRRSAARSCGSPPPASPPRATRSSPRPATAAAHGSASRLPRVRGDLRPRPAQPVPDGLRPERGLDPLPDQRRRRKHVGGGRRGHRRRELRLADLRGRARSTARLHRPAHRQFRDRVRGRWRVRPERLVGRRRTTAATCSPTARPTTCGCCTAAGTVDYAAPFTSTQLSVATDFNFGVRNGERALFYVNNSNGQLRKIVGPNAATSAAGRSGVHRRTATDAVTTAADHRRRRAHTCSPPIRPRSASSTRATGSVGRSAVWSGAVRARSRSACRPGRALRSSTSRSTTAAIPRSRAALRATSSPGSRARRCRRRPTPTSARCDVAANTAVVQVDAAGAANIQVYADVDVDHRRARATTRRRTGPVAAGRFERLTPAA